MITKAQLAEEQRKEAEYNKLMETVIQKTGGWGKFLGLMMVASDLLTKKLDKRIGVDKDGRPLVVYKSDIQKVMGVWAVPTHKVLSKDISQKKWGKLFIDVLTGGQITEMVNQKRAKFFDISPKDVERIRKKKLAEELAKKNANKPKTATTLAPDEEVKEDKNYVPIIFLSVALVGIAVFLVYSKKMK